MISHLFVETVRGLREIRDLQGDIIEIIEMAIGAGDRENVKDGRKLHHIQGGKAQLEEGGSLLELIQPSVRSRQDQSSVKQMEEAKSTGLRVGVQDTTNLCSGNFQRVPHHHPHQSALREGD